MVVTKKKKRKKEEVLAQWAISLLLYILHTVYCHTNIVILHGNNIPAGGLIHSLVYTHRNPNALTARDEHD